MSGVWDDNIGVASDNYLRGMSQENTLMRAEFNPAIRTYLLFYIAFMLLVTVVGIPLIVIWFLGWGQWAIGKYYRSLQCTLTDRHLQFSKGHFFKTEKTIPLENIQDLTFIDNPLLKYFDMRILKVETAGNSAQTGADMKLIGIMDAAGFKKQVMLARDQFQERRMTGGGPAASGGDDVVEVLREIHASIEGLRKELAERE